MSKRLVVIDYGAGNIQSVCHAFSFLGVSPLISADLDIIKTADALVLPGQGAFFQAMKYLRSSQLEGVIKDHILAGKAFLGICLGFQVLFEGSEEHGGSEGLGLFKGVFHSFDQAKVHVPHMGWNSFLPSSSFDYCFSSLSLQNYVYFVHSYYLERSTCQTVLYSDYQVPFVSAIQEGSVVGMQFHPEKSGDIGLHLLRDFVELL